MVCFLFCFAQKINCFSVRRQQLPNTREITCFDLLSLFSLQFYETLSLLSFRIKEKTFTCSTTHFGHSIHCDFSISRLRHFIQRDSVHPHITIPPPLKLPNFNRFCLNFVNLKKKGHNDILHLDKVDCSDGKK